MSSVLFTFQGKFGIKTGLSCAVSTDFQLLLYQIETGNGLRWCLFLEIFLALVMVALA